jgi:hypothetical protein
MTLSANPNPLPGRCRPPLWGTVLVPPPNVLEHWTWRLLWGAWNVHATSSL